MFKIIVSTHASKDVKGIPAEIRMRIAELVEYLERNPVPVEKYDVKKLKGERGLYRVRFGSYRLIYSVDFVKKEIIIVKIGKRENIYR